MSFSFREVLYDLLLSELLVLDGPFLSYPMGINSSFQELCGAGKNRLFGSMMC